MTIFKTDFKYEMSVCRINPFENMFIILLFGRPRLPRMICARPFKKSPICLSLEEATVHVGHEVLMNFYDKIFLIVSDRQGILDQQLRPHPMHLLNFCVH